MQTNIRSDRYSFYFSDDGLNVVSLERIFLLAVLTPPTFLNVKMETRADGLERDKFGLFQSTAIH